MYTYEHGQRRLGSLRKPARTNLIVRESSRTSTWIVAPSLILLRSASKTIAPIAAQLLIRDKHS